MCSRDVKRGVCGEIALESMCDRHDSWHEFGGRIAILWYCWVVG